jgi:Na+-transporting NADH:ubiquinone oxidoreductase subunit NqrD
MIKEYAPAIVLAVWTVCAALGVTITVLGLLAMTVAVVIHIRSEVHK